MRGASAEAEKVYFLNWAIAIEGIYLVIIPYAIHGFVWFSMFHFIIKKGLLKSYVHVIVLIKMN